jgi:hypothetical protein
MKSSVFWDITPLSSLKANGFDFQRTTKFNIPDVKSIFHNSALVAEVER